ncbi:MAG: carbon storage regulator [Planctomycetales bacterium]|nr:carbon storage regulator [Planctomycetales bacterium]
MLVLSRRLREVVVEGGGIEPMLRVAVLDISRSCVRLGFDCDRNLPVHCLEAWLQLSEGDAPRESCSRHVGISG